MVPSNRLLLWAAVLSIPAALWPVADPRAALPCLAGFMTFAVVVGVDAFLAPARLRGFGIELPDVLRLTRDRAATLPMDILNAEKRPGRLRVGIAWPEAVKGDPEEMVVRLPEDVERSRIEWRCASVRRGRFLLTRAVIETESRLGFWQVRRSLPARCELRVYPNLLGERRSLAALFLHRSVQGFHTQRQLGKGREFEKLREYVSGDSYDDIHWKATARRGHPITKVFQIERTQQVYVILDASRLSARQVRGKGTVGSRQLAVGSGEKAEDRGQRAGGKGRELEAAGGSDWEGAREDSTVLERFISAALMLGLAAEQQGDLFGLLAFTDRVETFLRAGHGQTHYGTCRDALYTLQPRVVTPDFDEVASFIRLRLRRRAMLFFLTSLDDPMLAESFAQHVDLICRHHLVLVNVIRPPGVAPLFEERSTRTVDDIYAHLGGHLRWQNLRELEKVLQRRGVRFSLLENEHLTVQLVSRYLEVKQRQLL